MLKSEYLFIYHTLLKNKNHYEEA